MTLSTASFAFLRGLAANNEKAWFEAHRPEYEQHVKVPMAALVGAVSAGLAARGLPLEGDAKRSMFRINRDTRFSNDKSPYKTSVGVVWYRQGSGKDGAGVVYFHLGARGCFIAAAFYMPEPEVLSTIRERMRVYPDKWLATVATVERAGLVVETMDSLKRMPKGFEDMKDSPVAEGLRMRSLIARRVLLDGEVIGSKLVPAIVDLAAGALPLLQFGWAAVDEVSGGRVV